MHETLQKGLRRLRHRWPEIQIVPRGNGYLPWTLDATVPAAVVARLAAAPGVSYVWVEGIPGIARKPKRRNLEFYCVWGSVAIQVEGRRRGLVDVEDRLVLVKAFSFQDAERRLRKEWTEYAAPHLNSRGELVRWQLIEVLDVYALFDDEIDPRGTEVYSRIRPKRMKRQYTWPRRARGA